MVGTIGLVLWRCRLSFIGPLARIAALRQYVTRKTPPTGLILASLSRQRIRRSIFTKEALNSSRVLRRGWRQDGTRLLR